MVAYSIIKKSQLEGALRLDAEYYQPEYLQAVETIKQKDYKRLGDIISVLTDYHANGSYEILRRNVRLSENPDYALMVRAIDLEKNDFETDVRYVSEHAYNFLKKTRLYGNEVIIDKIGNAGEVFLMPDLKKPVTLGMNLFMLRLEPSFDPIFVYIFLISKYGKALVNQRITGTVPTSIDKESVRGILIPIPPSEAVVEQVRSLTGEHLTAIQESRDLYQQAEDLLLEELGLSSFAKAMEDEKDLSWVVNLSDVKSANRVDAEYFQPKYQKLVEQIEKNNAKILGDLVSMKKGFEPGSEAYQEEGKLFIRVSSLSKFGIEDKDQKYLSKDLYQSLKKDFEPQVDEVLLTKDATPGITYVVKESIEGIISGGILRLKVKEGIAQEYLALCINSIIGKWQAERDAGGSVIAHWKPEQIKNLLIPVLPKSTQQKIAELVRKSHEARKKSKELLEEAKRKVEDMIEKGARL